MPSHLAGLGFEKISGSELTGRVQRVEGADFSYPALLVVKNETDRPTGFAGDLKLSEKASTIVSYPRLGILHPLFLSLETRTVRLVCCVLISSTSSTTANKIEPT